MIRLLSLGALAVAGTLALSACGSSGSSPASGSGSAGSAGASPSSGYGASARAPSASVSAGGGMTVGTRTTSLGTFLVDSGGHTLYLWDADHGATSSCTGACATAWPPLTATGTPKAGSGVKASLLGTTERAGGTLEVTYAGHPLYTFAGDSRPAQTAGQGSSAFGAPWWVVSAGGRALQR